LIREALARSGIDAAASLVVGDDHRDLEAASRAGVKAALVRTGKGRKAENLLRGGAEVPTYDDLLELARAILGK
jgi:phosphoglycolate phosphatase-like HAD superfamily hydrolase